MSTSLKATITPAPLTGEEVLARSVRNDETAIRCLIDDAKVYGAVALVIDTTSSAASLLMETAAATQVPVAYVTGLAMRRAADLYAGAAKTDLKTLWCSPTTPAVTPTA